jgi:hypothetical protein
MKLQTLVSLVGITIASDAFASDADSSKDMNNKNTSSVAAVKDDKGKEDAVGSQEPVAKPAAVRKREHDFTYQALDEFHDVVDHRTVKLVPVQDEDDEDLQAAIAASLLSDDVKPAPVLAQMTPVEAVSMKVSGMTAVDHKLLAEEMQMPGYEALKSLLDVVDEMFLRIDSCTDPVEKRKLQTNILANHESIYFHIFIVDPKSAKMPLGARASTTLERLNGIRRELTGTGPVLAEALDADTMQAINMSMQSAQDDQLDSDTLLALQMSMEEDRR